MVHGALRCAAVYLAGVLGGSLAASVLDPDVCLAGASGGVYALLAAHLANALLNFHAMRYGAVRLVAALAVASCDVGFAVHARYTKVSKTRYDCYKTIETFNFLVSIPQRLTCLP
jgi:rhomboid-related protein 1/2/3